MSRITLHRQVNSLKTALIAENLQKLSGFSVGFGADEWPVYESDDFPREAIELLRQFNIPIELDEDDVPQEDRDEEKEGLNYPDSQSENRATTIADILGLYLSDYEIIILFPRVIRACADNLEVSCDALYDVVLAHETAHAITHLCRLKETKGHLASFKWNSFGLATSESKELLAQLIPLVYFENENWTHHLDAMEKLSLHQTAKYNAYKVHAGGVSKKNSLLKLIVESRQEQEKEAKRSPSYKPEWWIEYEFEGKKRYSIRDSGIVFFADSEEGISEPLDRKFANKRISQTSLRELKAQIDFIMSLDIPSRVLTHGRRSRKGPLIKIDFAVMDGSDPEYYRSDHEDWKKNPTEFEEFAKAIERALLEIN